MEKRSLPPSHFNGLTPSPTLGLFPVSGTAFDREVEPREVQEALLRLSPKLPFSPLLYAQTLSQALGHEIYFKVESQQPTGAFKVRGALNMLLWLMETGNRPQKVVSYSSGNHAQAVAWACREFGIPVTIFMAQSTSEVKKQGTSDLGAHLVLTQTRQEAEALAHQWVETRQAVLIPPYDHPQIIAGQGTVLLECMQQESGWDAVFAPCGGGGLLSGLQVVAEKENIQVVGGEPLMANDAATSLRCQSIFKWNTLPMTIADGARTLCLAPLTFHYLKKINQLIEVREEEILYWTQWIRHLESIACEPTGALGLAAAARWLRHHPRRQKVVVIVSGGNTDSSTERALSQTDYLSYPLGYFGPFPPGSPPA